MKIVFVMRHSGYVRNFESTLRMLGDRGHQVHLAFEIADRHAMDPVDLASRLVDEYAGFTDGAAPARDDSWGLLSSELRLALDYLRYFEPAYRSATKLRARARGKAPRPIRYLAPLLARLPSGLEPLRAALSVADRAVPLSDEITDFLRRHAPDILLITPLVELGSPQTDYIRSARALGIRTGLLVYSWDNLSNKGLIRDKPDVVTVWNEAMRREAIELHGMPRERVIVTGAQPFDRWFNRTPSRTRGVFCEQVGLPADKPFVLYLCSSYFIAPDEVSFVRDWLRRLRDSSDARIRSLSVLVRPHPQNAGQWQGVDLNEFGPVSIWPATGSNPVDAERQADYFDSIFHSVAVTGINTSAMIESAIVGRPVLTLLDRRFQGTQEGTLHFHHLLHANGGPLHTAASFSEHERQLVDAITADGASRERQAHRNEAFVESFVRPYGANVAATPLLVDAIEGLAARPAPRPGADRAWAAVLRPALGLAAEYTYRTIVGARPREAAHEVSVDGRSNGSHPTGARRPPTSRERNIETGSGIALLDYDKARIRMRLSTAAEDRRIHACSKEPWTVEWLEQNLERDEILYDVGANVGAYTLVAVLRPGSTARVIAFEPGSASYAALCHNLALNGVSDRVIPLPIALAEATELAELNYTTLSAGGAQHVLRGSSRSTTAVTFAPAARQHVMSYRLDDVIAQFDLPRPNHLKIDVDGAEVAVLRGAEHTLREPGLRSVMIEVPVDLTDQVVPLLESAGLRLQRRFERPTKGGELLVWYGVFAR